MSYLGKIKVKVSYGTGFNLLCLAGAGALFVKAVNMMADSVRAKERHDMLKENKEQADELQKMAKNLYSDFMKGNKNAEVEETEKETEE